MAKKHVMLRLDGEVWEVAPGMGTDENTVKPRPKSKLDTLDGSHDQKAIDAGCDLIQTVYGGDLYHEVRQIS